MSDKKEAAKRIIACADRGRPRWTAFDEDAETVARAYINLVAEVERLRAALTNAAKQFEFYEREHRAKADRLHGNWDARSTEQENDYSIAAGKAATNERFAAMCRAALPEEK